MNTNDNLSRLALYPIFDKYIPINNLEYEKIEAALGYPVPESFRFVFQTYGCSGFNKSVHISLGDFNYPVAFLFGGGSSSYSVLNNLENYGDQFPCGILPFAGDEFGNLFCYTEKGQKAGILRWDHELDIAIKGARLDFP